MRHADTDRNFDDQSEAPWTVFEETHVQLFVEQTSNGNFVRLDISSHLISSHLFSLSLISVSVSRAGMTRTFLPGVPVGDG